MLHTERIFDENKNSAVFARVFGDVDLASAELFRRSLTMASESENVPLIVSLTDCRYFDSTGIGVLLNVRKRIGSRLRVVSPEHSNVRRLFEILGLVEHFDVLETVPTDFAATETRP